MISRKDLQNWFTRHPLSGKETVKHERIRVAAWAFAEVVLRETPPGADQSTTIRKIREAAMTANAAIACGEGQVKPVKLRVRLRDL